MILVPAENASEWTGPTGNNTWLLPGPPSILVDAGTGRSDHVLALERALGGHPLDLVLVTHGHVDHVSGVPALRDRWPDVVVRGGDAGEPLREGERFETPGAVLRAIHTPGHAPDHFCFFEEAARDLCCGDLARAGGTIVIPASRGGDLALYLDSLRRVRALGPARLLPAHGPIVSNPTALIDEYLAHRDQRTRQIQEALAQGAGTVDEIVAGIYPGLSPRLREAARETVRAHLNYLKGSRPPDPA